MEVLESNSNASFAHLSHCYDPLIGPEKYVIESSEQCAFWFEGVLLLGVGLFGIIGNTVSMLVLSRANMKNSFNHLLIALSFFDTIFITFCILDFSFARVFKWPYDWESEIYALLFPKGIYPLNNITFCCSTFLIIVIAYERYMAIYHPLHHRYRNVINTKDARVVKYVIIVVIFSLLINLPKFFETEVNLKTPIYNESFSELNMSESLMEKLIEENKVDTKISFTQTDLRSNTYYVTFYINFFRFLIIGILPVSSLIYFNVKIYLGIKARSTHGHNVQALSEINLAIILICIVIVFIVCNMPRLGLNIYEFISNSFVQKCHTAELNYYPPVWFHCCNSFSHWLLIVNASINFLIYCFMGTKFKSALRRSICGKTHSATAPIREIQLIKVDTANVDATIEDNADADTTIGR